MSETRVKHKENQTNYRKMTRVRILIHRTWAFCSTCSPITVADPDIQIRGVGSGHPDPEIRRGGAVSKNIWYKNTGEAGLPLDPPLYYIILVSVQTVSSQSGVLLLYDR